MERRNSVSYNFLSLVLDSMTESISVINEQGEIKYVNDSWSAFGRNNDCSIAEYDWIGINYLKVCDEGAAMGDEFSFKAGKGIRSVIDKELCAFYFEYPCHSPEERRWFMMRVKPFQFGNEHYFVISHQDISERKLSEEKIEKLAKLDGLTQIPNRRTFDEFISNEWKRCSRLNKPICLAIIDIDHFKLLNDTYGHQFGDECLIKIAKLLKGFVNRPSDLCARYGGEEFVLVWADTLVNQSIALVKELQEKILALKIPNAKSPTEQYLTASIGLVDMYPNDTHSIKELISIADTHLYQAKGLGRNQVKY